jgi:hypothetical protein
MQRAVRLVEDAAILGQQVAAGWRVGDRSQPAEAP